MSTRIHEVQNPLNSAIAIKHDNTREYWESDSTGPSSNMLD